MGLQKNQGDGSRDHIFGKRETRGKKRIQVVMKIWGRGHSQTKSKFSVLGDLILSKRGKHCSDDEEVVS